MAFQGGAPEGARVGKAEGRSRNETQKGRTQAGTGVAPAVGQYHCSRIVSGGGVLFWRRPETDLGPPSRQVQRREAMRWLMGSQ